MNVDIFIKVKISCLNYFGDAQHHNTGNCCMFIITLWDVVTIITVASGHMSCSSSRYTQEIPTQVDHRYEQRIF